MVWWPPPPPQPLLLLLLLLKLLLLLLLPLPPFLIPAVRGSKLPSRRRHGRLAVLRAFVACCESVRGSRLS